MQKCNGSATLQDYGSLLAETSVSMDGASRLLRLADLAQEIVAEPVAEEARELAARVSEGRFYVACIGQFKRGKSTLLNALVGHEVVPTGFVPVTAVPTVIRFGDELRAVDALPAGGRDEFHVHLRTLQEHNQGPGVVDVVANVGIEDDGHFFGRAGRRRDVGSPRGCRARRQDQKRNSGQRSSEIVISL